MRQKLGSWDKRTLRDLHTRWDGNPPHDYTLVPACFFDSTFLVFFWTQYCEASYTPSSEIMTFM